MTDERAQQQNAATEIDGKLVQQQGGMGDLENIEKALNHRFEVQERIMQIMIKHIDPAVDITMIEDAPMKTSSFAHKLYRILGGTFEYVKDNNGHPVVVKRDEKDEHGTAYYVYEAFGRYRSPYDQSWFEASGAFSSRHKFFGKKAGEFKPMSAVDEQSVRQAALTECFKKAIFGGLGFGKLTKEAVEEWDIDTSKIEGYSFQKGSKGGSTDDGKDRDVRAEIEKVCRELANENYAPFGETPITDPGAVLCNITAGDYKDKNGKEKHFAGYSDFVKITKRSLIHVHEKVIAARDEWLGTKGGE